MPTALHSAGLGTQFWSVMIFGTFAYMYHSLDLSSGQGVSIGMAYALSHAVLRPRQMDANLQLASPIFCLFSTGLLSTL